MKNETTIISSDAIGTTVKLYGTFFIIAWIYFEYGQKYRRDVYAPRDRNETYRNKYVARAYGVLEWIYVLLKMPDTDIMENCGLNDLMFLRFHRLCLKIATGGIALSLILLPTYGAGGDSESMDVLNRYSMANLSSGDGRLYVAIFAIYVMSILTMYLLLVEYRWYCEWRHMYLELPFPHQYSVQIDNLPCNLQSNATMLSYMQYLFPDQVRSVYVASELETLHEYVSKRDTVVDYLEYYLAKYDESNERPKAIVAWNCCCVPWQKEDAISYYYEQLDDLNDKIVKEIEKVRHHQAYIEKKLEEPVQFPADKFEEVPANETRKADEQTHLLSQIQKGDESLIIVKQPADPIETGMRSSGFVSFTSLQAANAAQQLLHTSTPLQLQAAAAPPVDDIEWSNIGLNFRQKQQWVLISTAVTIAIVCFWTVPTTLVGALSSVDELKQIIPQLETIIADHAWVQTLIQQIAPFALVCLNSLAPMIFDLFSKKEGHSSKLESQASLFTKLCYFQLVQIFFVSAISGTVFQSLSDLVAQPMSAPVLLGRTIPGRGIFFMRYILIQTCFSLPMELLRLFPRIMAGLHAIFAPQKTEGQQNRPWLGLRPLASPGEFAQPKHLADHFLVLFLMIVFAPISPALPIFGAMYFLVSDVVFRRQFMFVYDPRLSSGGAFWPHLYKFIILALLVAQITMVGVLGIKKSPAAFVAMFLPFLTFYYDHFIKKQVAYTAKCLPLDDCCRFDQIRSSKPAAYWKFLDNAYTQPSLHQGKPVQPDNDNRYCPI